MQLLVKANTSVSEKPIYTPKQNQQDSIQQDLIPQDSVQQDSVQRHPVRRDPIKQELRRRIYETLEVASDLAAGDRLDEIKFRLFAIQTYCKTVEKTFIVVERTITCDQFELGGSSHETATLFRGPNEDASVAICVTHKGSILHRNDCSWIVYKNEGDINPAATLNSFVQLSSHF